MFSLKKRWNIINNFDKINSIKFIAKLMLVVNMGVWKYNSHNHNHKVGRIRTAYK